jgi:phytoene synthase
VGLICIEIFGYSDKRAREQAASLGIAMQLTNILRDIAEDAKRTRVYIPQEDLRQFGYSEKDLTLGLVNDNFRALMRFEINRARSYFESSKDLEPLLAPRPRACVAVLHGLYERVLQKIEASHYDVFKEHISLPTAQKLMLTGTLWTQSLARSLVTHR